MTKPHVPWLVQLAQASVTADDILRGVICEVQVKTVGNIRMLQLGIMVEGWARCHDLEADECFRDKIEYRVYSKTFEHGHRWITLTAGNLLGAFCILRSYNRVP